MNSFSQQVQVGIPIILYGTNVLALRYIGELLHKRSPRTTWNEVEATPRFSDGPVAKRVGIADCGIMASVDDFAGMRMARRAASSILVLGRSCSSLTLSQLLSFGVRGFVKHEDVESQLMPAIGAVWEGIVWMPAQAVRGVKQAAGREADPISIRSHGLTSQEKAVLDLLEKNLCNKEIGAQLQICERTVKFHLSNIFQKLGVDNRYSAIEVVRNLSSAHFWYSPPESAEPLSTDAENRRRVSCFAASGA